MSLKCAHTHTQELLLRSQSAIKSCTKPGLLVVLAGRTRQWRPFFPPSFRQSSSSLHSQSRVQRIHTGSASDHSQPSGLMSSRYQLVPGILFITGKRTKPGLPCIVSSFSASLKKQSTDTFTPRNSYVLVLMSWTERAWISRKTFQLHWIVLFCM